MARISVDAGFSCPNRDGTISSDGCIFCDNRAFNIAVRNAGRGPLASQIEDGIAAGKMRYGAKKFMLYFQAFTNTYGPPAVLKARYDIVRNYDDIVALSIGTRPDCVNDEILDLIGSYSDRYEVWVEYGLQSIHDRTLSFINRGHTYADFNNAVRLTRKRKNIKIAAHVIIGLPGETKADIFETARAVGLMNLDGIKINPLHIIKGTRLAASYKKNDLLTLDEYVDIVVGFLEQLSPGTLIERLSADCPWELLVAPRWILDKQGVIRAIEAAMIGGETRQGKKWTKQI
ncbi:MAG: TIGR01212 family radical SAM protein [Candidatus Omnitrophica bacterium]|nr:TIGR01212 family radical SAM protein [Candidatus Omnitrophota bacterium]